MTLNFVFCFDYINHLADLINAFHIIIKTVSFRFSCNKGSLTLDESAIDRNVETKPIGLLSEIRLIVEIILGAPKQ